MRLKIFILFMLGIGCGESPVNSGENYGNLLDSPSGLVLTEPEHAGGWGRSDCTLCHNLDNIHLIDRTGVATDVEAIRRQTLEQGSASCPSCHGTNGI